MNRRLVYTIKRPGDKKPTGLALNCHLWHGAFRYFDMEHGHEIPGKVTEDGEDAFTFTSEGYAPGAWRFEKLTIERFRRETYKKAREKSTICTKYITLFPVCTPPFVPRLPTVLARGAFVREFTP